MGLNNLHISYKIAVTWYLQNKWPQRFYPSEFCKLSCKLGDREWFSFLVPNNNFPYPSVCVNTCIFVHSRFILWLTEYSSITNGSHTDLIAYCQLEQDSLVIFLRVKYEWLSTQVC